MALVLAHDEANVNKTIIVKREIIYFLVLHAFHFMTYRVKYTGFMSKFKNSFMNFSFGKKYSKKIYRTVSYF